jgi:hypothetical protein
MRWSSIMAPDLSRDRRLLSLRTFAASDNASLDPAAASAKANAAASTHWSILRRIGAHHLVAKLEALPALSLGLGSEAGRGRGLARP